MAAAPVAAATAAAAAPVAAAPQFLPADEKHELLGAGTYGCVYQPRFACDDEVGVPADEATRLGKVYFVDDEAIKEWKQAQLLARKIDPGHTFTPQAYRVCRIAPGTISPADAKRCQALVPGPPPDPWPASPRQLIMANAGKAWAHIRNLPIDQWLSAFRMVTSGLEQMYRRGYLHMDVKPGNLLFDVATNRATIIDFGLMAPSDKVFDERHMLERHDYLLYPPELAILRSIRQQQYTRIRAAQPDAERGRWPLFYGEANLTQASLDVLDAALLTDIDRTRLVDVGVARFRLTFPAYTSAQVKQYMRPSIDAYVTHLYDQQRMYNESAKQTILQTINRTDTYGFAYVLEWLMDHRHNQIVFDQWTTSDDLRQTLFRPARAPSPLERLAVSDLSNRANQLILDRQRARGVMPSAAQTQAYAQAAAQAVADAQAAASARAAANAVRLQRERTAQIQAAAAQAVAVARAAAQAQTQARAQQVQQEQRRLAAEQKQAQEEAARQQWLQRARQQAAAMTSSLSLVSSVVSSSSAALPPPPRRTVSRFFVSGQSSSSSSGAPASSSSSSSAVSGQSSFSSGAPFGSPFAPAVVAPVARGSADQPPRRRVSRPFPPLTGLQGPRGVSGLAARRVSREQEIQQARLAAAEASPEEVIDLVTPIRPPLPVPAAAIGSQSTPIVIDLS